MNVSSPRGEGGGKRRLKQTKFQGGKVGAGSAGWFFCLWGFLLCQQGGSAPVGRAPGHMSVIIPHAHQGIFRLAAELRVQEKAEQVRPLESWPEPGQLHFASFYWPKQVASPVQLQKLEKQTPPPDGSSCKVSMQRDMYTGRAGDRRPSFYH